MEEKKKASSPKNIAAVLSFFVLEVLAFVAFTFTNSYFVYGLFGLVIVVFVGLATYDEWRKKGSSQFLLFLIPLAIFTILSAVSNFSRSVFSVANNLITIIALLSFVLVGYLCNFIKGFKIKYALIAVYSGIFLVLLISFIYSMCLYSPFYTIVYRNMYYYYDGSRYLVTNSIEFLMGFAFAEVPITYFSLFASMLFTSVVGLRYISPKKETRLFIIYAVFALLGLICLVFTFNRYNVFSDIMLLFLVLFMMFYPKKGTPARVIKIIGLVALCLVGLFFLVVILNAQNNPLTNWLSKAISNNSLLNRIFNTNHWAQSYKSASAGFLEGRFLLGHQAVVGSTYDGLVGYAADGGYYITKYASSWFFDTFYTTGVFGVISITAFFVLTYRSLKRYYLYSLDSECNKNLVLTFVIGFVLYATVSLPFIGETHVALFTPLMRNSMFLVVLFFIGYTYTAPKKKAEKPIECEVASNEI